MDGMELEGISMIDHRLLEEWYEIISIVLMSVAIVIDTFALLISLFRG